MIAVTGERRKAIFADAHPAYRENLPSWQIFLDAYDGQGGFLTGDYLDQYPREEEASFKQRKGAARYHNYSETIVDLYARKLFASPPERATTNAELEAWLANVDGAGTDMTAFMLRLVKRALASGHAGALCDKTQEAPTGPSVADERARPYLTQYLPTAIQDWRLNPDTSIAAVKLREDVPNTDILSPQATGDASVRMLLWDDDSWVRVPHGETEAITSDTHDLGLVPFAVLAPKPQERWPLIGKSLLGNANVIRALFNRAAEEDQVLRDQAFSLLTVDVPVEGDVEKVKAEIAGDIGTTRAFVVHGTTKYVTADMAVPEALRDNIAYLVQEIYRMAFLRTTRESLDAETAEAIKLKHDELNDFLKSIAAGCAELEKRLIRFWCGWVSATEVAAETLFDSLELTINYADQFFLSDLETDLKAWTLALKQDLGVTMEKRLRLRMVHRLEPNLSAEDQKKVEQEIEAIASKPKPDPAALVEGLRSAAAARMPKPGQQPPGQQSGEGAAA